MVVATKDHVRSWVVPKFDHRDASLVLYLPLWYQYSDMTGSTIYSYDRNRYSGTVTGVTWGKKGRAFDGTDDDISAGDVAPLQFEYTNPFSLLAWIKPFANAVYTIVAKQDVSTAYRGYILYTHTTPANAFWFALFSDNAAPAKVCQVRTTNSVLSTTAFHMVASTYSGSGVASGVVLYHNGAATPMTTVADTLAGNTILNSVPFRVGIRESSDIDYRGDIGEVLVYNRVLSAAEILRIYQLTKWRY